jgi:hypothetical protein
MIYYVQLTRLRDYKKVEFSQTTNHECEGCSECEQGAEFIWSEGNQSCDCNRERFFKDEPYTHVCSHDRFVCAVVFPSFQFLTPIEDVYDLIHAK